MFFRISYFLGLFILAIFVTPVLVLPLTFFYAMRWYAIEILLLGYLFDVYFGIVSSFPYYTVSSFVVLIFAEISKKYLLVKTPTR